GVYIVAWRVVIFLHGGIALLDLWLLVRPGLVIHISISRIGHAAFLCANFSRLLCCLSSPSVHRAIPRIVQVHIDSPALTRHEAPWAPAMRGTRSALPAGFRFTLAGRRRPAAEAARHTFTARRRVAGRLWRILNHHGKLFLPALPARG